MARQDGTEHGSWLLKDDEEENGRLWAHWHGMAVTQCVWVCAALLPFLAAHDLVGFRVTVSQVSCC